MNINLTISPRLIARLVTAVEQLAADYRRLHPLPTESVDEEIKYFVQSDRQLAETERMERVKEMAVEYERNL